MISILATLAAMVSHSKLFASAPKDIWLKINCVKYELYYWKNLNAEDLTSKEDAFLASKNHETHLFGFYQIFSWELYA